MPASFQLQLIELKHRPNSAQAVFQAAPANSLLIALDEHGEAWDSKQLAQKLATWQLTNQNISFLVGGPDGFTRESLQQAQLIWSLSNLTFPHHLIRIIVAEQLYRAWSILQQHPYHRA